MRTTKGARIRRKAFGFILALVVATFVATELPGNLYMMIIEPNYIIPNESSIATFSARRMNSGSGDWWESGEDSSNFYYNIDSDGVKFLVIPKARLGECPGFNPDEITTWCKAIRKEVGQNEVPEKNWIAGLFR